MRVELDTSWQRSRDQIGGDLVLMGGFGRVRAAAYFGSPPGSHIGFWRTRAYGLHGLNLRVGRRIIGPCLTVFVHWRGPR